MRKQIRLLILALAVLFYPANIWAWDDKTTHQDLSIRATENSILSSAKGDYLKNLGFDRNLGETFTLNGEPKNVKDWIKFGSLMEDAGNIFTSKYYNHFHNPTLAWEEAGLNMIYPDVINTSSLIWAQDDSNEWSWQKARNYYYLALTSSSPDQRSENFAKTFKGVGHIIHLIQDVAQPAHARND